MTVEETRMLLSYNRWANRRILVATRELSPDDFIRDLQTSHSSVRGWYTSLAVTGCGFASGWVNRQTTSRLGAMPYGTSGTFRMWPA